MYKFLVLICFFTKTIAQISFPSTKIHYVISGDTLTQPYYRNISVDSTSDIFKYAIISLHGDGRNAAEHFGVITQAAIDAGVEDSTIIFAPMYLHQEDIDQYNLGDNVLYWSSTDWNAGDLSRSTQTNPRPFRISSFSTMDTIYHRLSANYPNLKRIVLTGHSAGSQMVVRYAAAGGGRAMTQGTEINLFFVSINTPSFLYFDGNRVLDEGAETFDFGPTDCGTANQYKYGLENLNQYMEVVGESTIIENYMLSNVVYLIGQYDLGGQTNTCARMVQGNNRLIRTHIYFSYLGYYYGDTIYQNHKAAEIPSAYHEFDQVVFTDCGMNALFDIGDCGIYIDGTELFNHEPIAQAGPDQTINPLGVAQLDASGSYDVDGLIVSYNWEQISGLPINIQSSESLLAQFTMPDSGYVDIQLEVFDNEGALGRDTTRLVVNSPPTSNAGENQVVGFSQVVLLDGSESSDEEGEISGFLWEQLGGEAVSLFSADQEVATFYTPTISGALSFVLTVFDNHGLSDQDTIDVYISSLSIVSKKNNAVISGVVLFPNPFNSALIINLNNTKTKKISIYDINGKTIESWLINNRQNINKQIIWSGKDENGFEIKSGLYFVRFQGENYSIIKKVTYLK